MLYDSLLHTNNNENSKFIKLINDRMWANKNVDILNSIHKINNNCNQNKTVKYALPVEFR